MKTQEILEKCCFSNWYPRLCGTGVPVPKTEWRWTTVDLWDILDGKTPDLYDRFHELLRKDVERMGLPCFLRTGHTSGKHGYRGTCFVTDADNLHGNVFNLVDFSGACFPELPVTVWVVREMLPLRPAFHAFDGLPICRERRYFIQGGHVVKHLPYWPAAAMHGTHLPTNWPFLLEELNRETPDEVALLSGYAEMVGTVFPDEAWSLDFLETDRGWYAIDMALAEVSWGWKEDV